MKIWREPPSPSLRRRPPRHCDREPKAKRAVFQGQRATGLLRRFAPRNDDPSGTLIGKITMQPHPLTSVMQLSVTAAAVTVAACAITFTVWTWREHRNADLVRIGVSVLRVEPKKEKQISAATREWALIDANSGGVKFSPEARELLLKKPLSTGDYFGDHGSSYYEPVKPSLGKPSSEQVR